MTVFLDPHEVNALLSALGEKSPYTMLTAHELEAILRKEGKIGPLDYYRRYNDYRQALEFDR